MTDREFCEKLVETEGAFSCSGYECSTCPVRGITGDCGDRYGAFKNAKQWLADHPEKPADPETVSKYATRGESSYSLTLRAGRITIYRWHDKDSKSVDFGGTAEDFNQFDESQPEEWFGLAAKMIAGKGKK